MASFEERDEAVNAAIEQQRRALDLLADLRRAFPGEEGNSQPAVVEASAELAAANADVARAGAAFAAWVRENL